ncbi:MAG: hypothetical protein JNL43_12145 [Flavobacteriales bacterium]|nr:hypothetical protein [Flavobacteriales bacterium]
MSAPASTTGPVLAGIAGAKKFQHDIRGDPVNAVSRMESCGGRTGEHQ